MNDVVSVEVLNQSSTRASVEIIEQQGARVVEVTTPAAVQAVEVIHPGPQGPPGEAVTRLAMLQDVDASARTDGSLLYFDADRDKFVADSIETKIRLTDGGNF